MDKEVFSKMIRDYTNTLAFGKTDTVFSDMLKFTEELWEYHSTGVRQLPSETSEKPTDQAKISPKCRECGTDLSFFRVRKLEVSINYTKYKQMEITTTDICRECVLKVMTYKMEQRKEKTGKCQKRTIKPNHQPQDL